MSFIVVSAASLASLVVVHGITFLIGRRIGRYNIVDVAWGIGFVAVAAVAAALGAGDLFRRLLLLILVAVWGIRLACHMIVKSAGVIMDRGLRAWTRHPNYFGDACVWWGLWLAGIAAWVSLLTVLSPVLMTYFLVYATGAKLTEKYMRYRHGFAEYRSHTSFFVPTLPKSRLP
jgi:steroid 5-alpha reductase family enzyme